MVLQGPRSCQHMEQVFHDISHEVLRDEQNQHPSWKNFQLLADIIRILPRSVGEAARIHPCLPTPWNGKLVDSSKLLQRANFHIQSPHRCYYWRSVLLTQSMELWLSLRRWSPTRVGVKTDSKPKKTACIPWRNTLWYRPITLLTYTMQGVWKLWTLGEQLH